MNKYLIAILAAVMAASAAFAVDPVMVVSPAKLKATGTPLQGATAQSATVYQYSGSDVTSHYTVAVGSSDTWMTVSPTTGSTTGEYDTVTVTFVTTNLSEGVYDGTITITETNAPYAVKTIDVSLKVNQDENIGISIGPSSAATATSGIAIGDRSGRAVAVGASSIQIGGGTNYAAGTTKVREYPVLDSSGNIYRARLGTTASTTNYALYGVTYSSPGTNIFTYRQQIFVNGILQSVGASTITTNAIP